MIRIYRPDTTAVTCHCGRAETDDCRTLELAGWQHHGGRWLCPEHGLRRGAIGVDVAMVEFLRVVQRARK